VSTLTTILIATTSRDKLREMMSVLGELPITFKTLADFAPVEAPEETGLTFQENARLKALYYAKMLGVVTLAEDSGFEVGALNGEPGVYSARYLRPDATYPDRFADIYARLQAKRIDVSPARYVCALCLVDGGQVRFETTGIVDGQLAREPTGTGGFGYDPVFYYPPYGQTFGEVSAEQKLAVSHRGRAIRVFRQYLSAELNV